MPPTPDASAPGPAAPDRDRADACPGALRLHQADDGALARVRVPGGLLTVPQVLALVTAAETLGDAQLETTSRGNVQLRGLGSGCGAELAALLRPAGLLPSDTHERVRNIVASPLAGLDGRGHADVQEWVRELDAGLCASGWAAGLSGKFLFALDDGRGDVAALDADVTLIARPGGTAVLRLGRAATVRPVDAAVRPVDAALAAAREFLAAAGGRAWHLREVPELTVGSEPMPVLDGGHPEFGVLGLSAGVPGASGGSAAGVSAESAGGLSVGMRFGRADAEQWRLLADVAGAGGVRLTPWRGVVLPGAAAERLGELAAAGFTVASGTAWDRATACTGLPGCGKSLADVRGDAARALAAGGPGAGPGGLPVHWSGCERRCGHPAGRWVDVLATGQGYRVTLNGGEVDGPASDGTSRDVTDEQMAEAVAEARRKQ